jgi:hypothetical protein
MNPWTFLIFTLANAFWITLSYRVGGDCSWLATKRQPLRAVASLPIETQVSHLVDLFSVMYRDTMPAQSPPSIFSADDKLKAYDQNGTKIIIEPTEYPPIDLEEPVKVAIDHVLQVLALSPESKSKGPIHVVRGVGGGKTLALTVLRGSLAAMDDVLPILITYNSRWSVDDFQRLATLFPDRCDVGYALTVIARMASTYYDVSRDDAESMLYAYEVTLKGLMQGLSGRDAIAAFTIHLARHANKTQVVLLVDESVACVEALDKTYHQYRPTGSVMSKYLIDAMLEFRYDEYGLRGALVLSGTVPVIARTDAGRTLRPFVLPENLNTTAVVAQRLLVDVDIADGSKHVVVAEFVRSQEVLAVQVLEFLAATFCSLPKGLEIVQDELRCLVDRTSLPRKIVLTPEIVVTVFNNSMIRFHNAYSRLRGATITAEHLYAALYGVKVPYDDVIADGIGSSVWINSLAPENFPAKLDARNPTRITPRTSLLSLYATIPSDEILKADTAEYHVRELYNMLIGWPTKLSGVHQLGTALEQLSVKWMCMKLTAAARAGRTSVTVEELLAIRSIGGVNTRIVAQNLRHQITLPPDDIVRVHQLRSTCYSSKGSPRKDALTEIDAICLSEQMPCVVLQAAPQDCWDYGLMFLGRKNENGNRSHHLLIFDNKAGWVLEGAGVGSANRSWESDLEPGVKREKARLLLQEQREKERFRQSKHFNGSAQLLQGTRLGGAGQCLARGDYLYVYQTTKRMDSSTAFGNVVTVCERDTSEYFNLIYAPYKAMKAVMEATIASTRTHPLLKMAQALASTRTSEAGRDGE